MFHVKRQRHSRGEGSTRTRRLEPQGMGSACTFHVKQPAHQPLTDRKTDGADCDEPAPGSARRGVLGVPRETPARSERRGAEAYASGGQTSRSPSRRSTWNAQPPRSPWDWLGQSKDPVWCKDLAGWLETTFHVEQVLQRSPWGWLRGPCSPVSSGWVRERGWVSHGRGWEPSLIRLGNCWCRVSLRGWGTARFTWNAERWKGTCGAARGGALRRVEWNGHVRPIPCASTGEGRPGRNRENPSRCATGPRSENRTAAGLVRHWE